MRKTFLDLNWFGEDGAGSAPAAGTEAGGSAQTADNAGAAPVQVGETVGGMKVTSPRVAAAMERQMQRHPELRQVYGRTGAGNPAPNAGNQQAQQVDAQAAQQQAEGQAQAEDAQSRWEQLKKGEFAELYGADVKAAIQERFKNQKDLQSKMDKLEPALKVLRERAGVDNDDDLIAQIMDDDSLYEEAANEAGMTVSAYKEFQKFKAEHDQHIREQAEQQRQEAVGRHYMELTRQAEAMKAQFPDFDLDKELQNERFLRLTSPEIGVSVEDAYFAVHHKELGPQMLAYGMQRAKDQMAQTIMVNGARPREGGLNAPTAAAKMDINFKSLSRAERNRAYARVHAGGRSRDY